MDCLRLLSAIVAIISGVMMFVLALVGNYEPALVMAGCTILASGAALSRD